MSPQDRVGLGYSDGGLAASGRRGQGSQRGMGAARRGRDHDGVRSFLDRRRPREHAKQVRDYLDYLVASAPHISPSVIDLRDRPVARIGERSARLLVTTADRDGGGS